MKQVVASTTTHDHKLSLAIGLQMSWFTKLTGVTEKSPTHVRDNIQVVGDQLVSLANDKKMLFGEFATPSLHDLRGETANLPPTGSSLKIQEMVGNVQSIHQDPSNQHAVFQVASQFNCLEMAAPHLTPESGIGIYQNDRTQGPACAISAGAGTIYRNYFVNVNGETGQSASNQIDCLKQLGESLGNWDGSKWRMQNGYCLPTQSGLKSVCETIRGLDSNQLEELKGKLRIGLQSETEVTLGDSNHTVTQVFASALPVSYSRIAAAQWTDFAQLVLDAAYEATFRVASANAQATGCNKLFLTLLGGGAFGNKTEWIFSAIERSAKMFAAEDLNVYVVSYGRSNSGLKQMLDSFS